VGRGSVAPWRRAGTQCAAPRWQLGGWLRYEGKKRTLRYKTQSAAQANERQQSFVMSHMAVVSPPSRHRAPCGAAASDRPLLLRWPQGGDNGDAGAPGFWGSLVDALRRAMVAEEGEAGSWKELPAVPSPTTTGGDCTRSGGGGGGTAHKATARASVSPSRLLGGRSVVVSVRSTRLRPCW
jgi:hypothetical protein